MRRARFSSQVGEGVLAARRPQRLPCLGREAAKLGESVQRRLATPWRIASFSSLTRGSGDERPDHADPGLPQVALPAEEAGGGPVDGAPVTESLGLLHFARGTRAGDCLHKVFEGIDFFMVWFFLMLKRYDILAKHYVQLGDRKRSKEEIIDLLKSRTRRFSKQALAEYASAKA